MQNKRNAVAGVDFAQPADVEARGGGVTAVQVADGDGQRIRTGFGDEEGRLFDIGEDVRRRRVARALASGSGVAHAPQLGFDIDACGMGEPCDEAGPGDIFFQRQAGTVEHHRTEARADGADAGFGALPVVEVHGDRDFRIACGLQENGGHQFHGRPGELHFRKLQDDGRPQLFGCGYGSHDILDAQAVECPDGIMASMGIPYDFSERG